MVEKSSTDCRSENWLSMHHGCVCGLSWRLLYLSVLLKSVKLVDQFDEVGFEDKPSSYSQSYFLMHLESLCFHMLAY